MLRKEKFTVSSETHTKHTYIYIYIYIYIMKQKVELLNVKCEDT